MVLAAAMLAIAWATLQWMILRTELVTLRTELRLTELSLKDAQQRREADHILWQHQLAASPQPPAAPPSSAASSADQSKTQLDPAALKIVLLASPRAGSPPTLAAVVWNPATQEGIFTAQNLPPPAPGQVYQLWEVDPQYPRPVAAGVIGVDPQTGAARGPFKPGQPLPAAVNFFVTLERQGDGIAPEGPVVLSSP
jgi:hypothetical protein